MKRLILVVAVCLAGCQPSRMASQAGVAQPQASPAPDTLIQAHRTTPPRPACDADEFLAYVDGWQAVMDELLRFMHESLPDAVTTMPRSLTGQVAVGTLRTRLVLLSPPPCAEDANEHFVDGLDRLSDCLGAAGRLDLEEAGDLLREAGRLILEGNALLVEAANQVEP